MNLKQEILNIFNRNRTDECSIEPVDFFSGEKASQLLQSLNCTSAYPQGLSPIETLSLKIARISRAEYIVLTRFTDDEKLKIEAIAQPDNSLKSATKYFSTQSVSAILKGGIAYSNNPDEILSAIGQNHHKAKSFTALLIHDNENNPVGAAFGFSKSSNNEKTLLNTLRFFTFNITSELSHLINKEKLENKNKELLHTEEELKLKNQLLDNLNKNISKAKQVVDESSRLKSAFLANLSHEIRTPMNVIMGFTELLNADNMTNGQRRNYIDIIQQNGTRLLHIMDSLIDISRFQAKNVGKEQQSFSLNQMMQQLHNNFQSEIDVTGKPLTLRLKIDSKEGQDIVTLDKEATYKVLNHILENAIKFTASGFVHFGYEIHDQQILFYVEDSGIGVPEGKEKEIFDLFRQGDLRLSRQFGGTGLGLAIAKRYVNAMNGQIWCNKKENSDQGSVFKFTLPFFLASDTKSTGLINATPQLLFSTTNNQQ